MPPPNEGQPPVTQNQPPPAGPVDPSGPEPAKGGPEAIADPPPVDVPPPVEVPGQPPAEKPVTQEQIARLVQLDRENWQAKQQIQKLQQDLEESKAFREKFLADPYEAAVEAGLDVDTYAQRAMNDGKPTANEEIRALREELANLKEFRQGLEKQEEDEKITGYYQNFAGEVESYVAQNQDQFQAIQDIQAMNKELGGKFDLTSFVRSKVDAEHHQSGKVLTPAEISGILHSEALKQIELFSASPTLRRIMADALKAEGGAQPPAPAPTQQPAPPQPRKPVSSGMETDSEIVDLASLPHAERLKRVAAKYQNQD